MSFIRRSGRLGEARANSPNSSPGSAITINGTNATPTLGGECVFRSHDCIKNFSLGMIEIELGRIDSNVVASNV